jgi:pimeloyl-ACP methyl ester carboxylesterase
LIAQSYLVDGARLESIRIPASRPDLPVIVMLHEGLGSISHWKDFPAQVAERTGAGVFVYSRRGHGASDPAVQARSIRYLHHEAEIVLREILRQAEIKKPVLLGHSDGASIAILYAGMFPESPRGIILEAPHVFVEQKAIAGIERARHAFESTDLPQKLGRHHADADALFRAWYGIWLSPEFRGWNIEEYLGRVRCPVLMIQGIDDEYGTLAQTDAIRARIPQSELAVLDSSKHSPHRDQTQITLDLIAKFVARVSVFEI